MAIAQAITPGGFRLKINRGSQGNKKHININKFAGLSRDWVGAEKLFMCLFFSGHSLWGKTQKKIPSKFPGQPCETFVYGFFSLCVFFAPKEHCSLWCFLVVACDKETPKAIRSAHSERAVSCLRVPEIPAQHAPCK